MREKILAHRIRWLIGLCTFLVLFGCSGFPIYNFTTGRQLGSWYFMLMLCIGYFEIGSSWVCCIAGTRCGDQLPLPSV